MERVLLVASLVCFMFYSGFSTSEYQPDYDSLLTADFQKAASFINDYRCEDPSCLDYQVEALRGYARELSRRNRYDSSNNTFQKSLDLSRSKSDLVYRLMAINYMLKADYNNAKAYLHRSVSIARDGEDYLELGRGQNLYGVIFKREGNLDSALVYYNEAASTFRQVDDQESVAAGIANVYKNQGNIYHSLGLYEQALKSHTQALEVEESRQMKGGLYKTYLNISNVYRAVKKFDSFRKYLDKAMVLATDLGNERTLAIAYNNYGNHYAEDLKNDSSKFFFQKSLMIAEQIDDLYYQALTHHNLGNFFRDHQQFDSATYHYRQALAIRESSGDLQGSLSTRSNLGGLYVMEGDPRAESLLLAALAESQTHNYYDLQQDALIFLVDYYKRKGDFNKALTYYETLSVAKDSLNDRDFYNRISAVETQFAVSNYQDQLELTENQLAQNSQINKLLIAVIILFFGIVGVLVFFYFKQRNYNARLQQKNLKIDTLMRELHHRVKNNLQVISSLLGLQSMRLEDENARKAVEDGKSRVRAMTLIHQRLYTQDDATSINAPKYIQNLIEELTATYGFQGRINTELDLADINLDVDQTLPLGLILNELISNSFKYAYKDIEKPLLKLELITENRKGKLIIADNGKGFDQPINLEEAKSFGLRLVNILTQQMKGSMQVSYQHGLKYELSFNLN